METQLALYLSIFHSRAFTGNQFSRLLKHFGTIGQLQNTPAHQLVELGFTKAQISLVESGKNPGITNKLVSTYLDWGNEAGHHILCFEDHRYPPLLKEIDCPPPLLFVIGEPEVLRLPQLALVGSRKATSMGRQNAFWMSQTLAQCGLSICSGMATGIDSQAHLGALSIGGNTVAVLGTGVDRIYPAGNRNLAAQIGDSGALVSEFPLGTPPAANHFPRRNRIISGMSLGVLVVEAALRSGTLITARTAMEQNREVFAIPGAINNPLSRGCHGLIRDGAKLVESPSDVLEELQIQFDQELWLGRSVIGPTISSKAIDAADPGSVTRYANELNNSERNDNHSNATNRSTTTRTTINRSTTNNRSSTNRSKNADPDSPRQRIKQSQNVHSPSFGYSGQSRILQNYQPSAIETKILAALDSVNCHLDVLVRETQLDLQQLIGPLLQLESHGLIQQVAGRYSRIQHR